MARAIYDDYVIGVDRQGRLILRSAKTGDTYTVPASDLPRTMTPLEAHIVGRDGLEDLL